MKYEQALVIGRFGPYCKNHQDLLHQASNQGREVLVGIGIPNYERAAKFMSVDQLIEYKLKNLFEYQRTTEIIQQNFECTVAPVKDIFDSINYANNVKKQFEKIGTTIDDCILIGENPWTIKCFEGILDYTIARDNKKFHATDVRREIYKQGKSNKLAGKYTELEILKVGLAQQIIDANGEGKTRLLTKYNFLFGENI